MTLLKNALWNVVINKTRDRVCRQVFWQVDDQVSALLTGEIE